MDLVSRRTTIACSNLPSFEASGKCSSRREWGWRYLMGKETEAPVAGTQAKWTVALLLLLLLPRHGNCWLGLASAQNLEQSPTREAKPLRIFGILKRQILFSSTREWIDELKVVCRDQCRPGQAATCLLLLLLLSLGRIFCSRSVFPSSLSILLQ
jgi:hypothetical protein